MSAFSTVPQHAPSGRVNLTHVVHAQIVQSGQQPQGFADRFFVRCLESGYKKLSDHVREVMSFEKESHGNNCVTIAFVGMLCKLLLEQGIEIHAKNMLAQMKDADVEWLRGEGMSPNFRELESFMQKTWFKDQKGNEFKVPVALTLCFNAQCAAQTKDAKSQQQFESALFDAVRKGSKSAQFVVGIVNVQGVEVNGKMSEDIMCLHENMGSHNSHAVGIIRTEPTSVQAWNTCGDSYNVLTYPIRYVQSFIIVNLTQIEVRKTPDQVQRLLESQPEEGGWLQHKAQDTEQYARPFKWLIAPDETYYYKVVKKRGTFFSLHPNTGPAPKADVRKTEKRDATADDAESQRQTKRPK